MPQHRDRGSPSPRFSEQQIEFKKHRNVRDVIYTDPCGQGLRAPGVEMSKPNLVNILRNTLLQMEGNIQSGEDEPAVSELRKQIALTVAEVELIKDRRSAESESEPRLFLVSRRRPYLVEDNSTARKTVADIEQHRENAGSRQS